MIRIIFIALILEVFTGIPLLGQSWKQYPYQPENSFFRFPDDEGFHPQESIEWWYINGHATGAVTGHEYSFMVSYFYEPVLLFDGFRIFSICDETAGVFYTQTRPCTYPILDTNMLRISADIVGGGIETFINDTGSDGNMIPFDYLLEASSDKGALHIHCSAQKPPLIIADSGLINQGASGYSYYYSLTDLLISGTVVFEGITEEITGMAWIDRQYGNFAPYIKEEYEWLSVQLNNHVELNIWNIFTPQNTIPATSSYRICSISFPDGTFTTTSDFTMERIKFSYTPDEERCYASRWHIKLDTLNIDLMATANYSNHEVELPFRFFEGSISVEGSVNGTHTSGKGFAELLHSYELPELQIVYPEEGIIWDPQQSLQWEILNPDDGNILQYDIEISNNIQLIFNKIIQDYKFTSLYWNPSYFNPDTLVSIRITGYSADSSLNSQITQEINVMPWYREYNACVGGQMSWSVSLHNPGLLFQWLKDGVPLTGETDSLLYLIDLQQSASGEYRCVMNGSSFTDTTLAFLLSVGDHYSFHEYKTLCKGDEFLGYPVKPPGPLLITDTLNSVLGCDSIVYYHIMVDTCTPSAIVPQFTAVGIRADCALHKILLQFPDDFTGNITLVDLHGQCISTEFLSAARNHEISLKTMRPGIYIIRLSGTFNVSYKFVVSC